MKLSQLRALASALLISFSLNASAEVNLSVSPLALIRGTYNAMIDFKVSDKWAIGPALAYTDKESEGFDTTAYNIGFRGHYFFEGTFKQGWYVAPGIQYVSAKVTDDHPTFGEIEGKASGVALGVIGGYFWIWENFNIELGIGPVYYSLGEITAESKSQNYKEDYGGYSGLGIGIDFNLGWKF